MNAMFPFPRRSPAADAVHADAHIGSAMDVLSDAAGAIYARRSSLTPTETQAMTAIRNALVAMAHARNLIEPLMTERAP